MAPDVRVSARAWRGPFRPRRAEDHCVSKRTLSARRPRADDEHGAPEAVLPSPAARGPGNASNAGDLPMARPEPEPQGRPSADGCGSRFGESGPQGAYAREHAARWTAEAERLEREVAEANRRTSADQPAEDSAFSRWTRRSSSSAPSGRTCPAGPSRRPSVQRPFVLHPRPCPAGDRPRSTAEHAQPD